MSSILFLDNDAILKLVACNLFWESVTSLGLTKADLRILPDAKYVFRKSRRVVQKYPQPIRDTAIAIVEGCNKIEPGLSNE